MAGQCTSRLRGAAQPQECVLRPSIPRTVCRQAPEERPLTHAPRPQVAALARRGLAVHLVTGDNWRTARAVAAQLAILNVCAECLPGAKADKIRVRRPAHLTWGWPWRCAGRPACITAAAMRVQSAGEMC